MPRVDLTTSELHALLAPVLPHASTDTDQPELGVVRLEARAGVLSAVATDRTTLAATRHPADDIDDFTVTIDRDDAANLLARPAATATPATLLSPWAMARWAKAPRKGDVLQFFPGPTTRDPILVLAGDSFVGVWAPVAIRDDVEPQALLEETPWQADLARLATAEAGDLLAAAAYEAPEQVLDPGAEGGDRG